jgi:hypothetical protein
MMYIPWNIDPQSRSTHTYLGLLFVPELGEYSSDGLTLGVSDCTQTIPSVRPDHETGNIRDDEP